MKQILELCCVPVEEKCQQLGSKEYNYLKARHECLTFKNQLERTFPDNKGCYFKITTNQHDFGIYHEVAVIYDDNIEEQIEFVFKVESNLPLKWDKISIKEIEIFNKKESV